MKEIDIWLKTPPIGEEKTSFRYLGRSKFDEHVAKLISKKFKGNYNSRIMTPYSIRYTEKGLEVGVGECLFSEHQILNKTNEFTDGRKKALEQRAFPMSVMGLTVTSDGQIVFSRRDFRHSHANGRITLSPGGYVDAEHDRAMDFINPFLSVEREYNEEFGAETSTIERLTLQGITFSNKDNFGCSLSYKLETKLTFQELKTHYDKRHDLETNEIQGIEFSGDSLLSFIFSNLEEMSNHAVGTCLLVGRNEFGIEWYEKALKEIRKNGDIVEIPDDFFDEKRDVNKVIMMFHQLG